MTTSTNKRLAKNTIILYIRMFVLMLITIYTSRIVLYQLGIRDYGIFNLVGSFTAIFSSIEGLFASSTQRFLNNEMGKGNFKNLQKVYSISVIIHFLISLLFLLLAEIAGYVFFETDINIPVDRIFAAKCVFQFSVFSIIVGILAIPFDAEIIAHERMNVYALIALFEGLSKLFIAYCLTTVDSLDKLIVYGFLNLVVSVLARLIMFVYCKRCFEECRFVFDFDKVLLKSMTTFAGWQFLGNTAYTLTHNGTNIVLNIFGGPVANAARGVANQINLVMAQFLSNITMAINPHVVKLYAKEEKEEVFNLLVFMSKVLLYVQLCMVIPLFFLAYEIMSVWLVEIPMYTISFLKILLIWSLVRTFHSPIDTLFKATGDIKLYQICEGLLSCLTPVGAFLALKMGCPLYSVFIVLLFAELTNLVTILLIASHKSFLNLINYFGGVILPCAILIFAFFLIALLYNYSQIDSFGFKLALTSGAELVCFLLMFFTVLSKKEKIALRSLLPHKFQSGCSSVN